MKPMQGDSSEDAIDEYVRLPDISQTGLLLLKPPQNKYIKNKTVLLSWGMATVILWYLMR